MWAAMALIELQASKTVQSSKEINVRMEKELMFVRNIRRDHRCKFPNLTIDGIFHNIFQDLKKNRIQ